VVSDERALVAERVDALLAEHPANDTPEQEFWGAQYDHGLAWVSHPEGLGGLGVSPRWQAEVDRRITAAGGSTRNRAANLLGIGMGAPTIVAHGTEAQQQRERRLVMDDQVLQLRQRAHPEVAERRPQAPPSYPMR
jgi:alkylation response protein AidB-like acyl-CoA dehydrogenase